MDLANSRMWVVGGVNKSRKEEEEESTFLLGLDGRWTRGPNTPKAGGGEVGGCVGWVGGWVKWVGWAGEWVRWVKTDGNKA